MKNAVASDTGEEGPTLAQLIRQIISQGLGNGDGAATDPDGHLPAWERAEFADAIPVSMPALGAWLNGSGNISPEKLRAVAGLVSRGDAGTRDLWIGRLSRARARFDLDRFESSPPKPSRKGIGDIRFCLPGIETFDPEKLVCRANCPEFPAGTREVMVSFSLYGLHRGEPFTRKWYRNGQRFLKKDDINAPPWNGFTFLADWKGLAPGTYALRVEAGDAENEAEFTISLGPAKTRVQRLAWLIKSLAWRLERGRGGRRMAFQGKVEGRREDWSLETGSDEKT